MSPRFGRLSPASSGSDPGFAEVDGGNGATASLLPDKVGNRTSSLPLRRLNDRDTVVVNSNSHQVGADYNPSVIGLAGGSQ